MLSVRLLGFALLAFLGFSAVSAIADSGDIAVSEDVLVFQTSGECRRDLTLEIYNEGSGALILSGFSLSGLDTAAFRLLDAPARPITLSSADRLSVTIQFIPSFISDPSASATLYISSNDPDQNPKQVELRGYISADFEPTEVMGVQICKQVRAYGGQPYPIDCLFDFPDETVSIEDRSVYMIIQLKHVNSMEVASYAFEGPNGEKVEKTLDSWGSAYWYYYDLAGMEVAAKNRSPGTWTFRYYVSNDVDTPTGTRKEICSKSFVIASGDDPQDYDGIWKDTDETMNFYVQTYTPGSGIIITTPDLITFASFLDDSFKDGIDGFDLGGDGTFLNLTFNSHREGIATLTKPRSDPQTYHIEKRFNIPSDSSRQGLWRESCQGSGLNFYFQDYSTGSAIVIATPDARTYYVFQDADVTDGVYADQFGSGNRHLTMVFGESAPSSLSPVSRCFGAPYGITPNATAFLSLKSISSENRCSPSTITNSLGMTFACIPDGTFTMGTPPDEPGQNFNENPQHQVTLSERFYLQTEEVSLDRFRAFVQATEYKTEAESNGGCWCLEGNVWQKKSAVNWENTGFGQDDSHPVVCVSWNDAKAFAQWLSQKEGRIYRLPTEAEWEYACRASSTTALSNGKINELECGFDANLNAIAWYCYNSATGTQPIGKKTANAWGLYDMHGNVSEWVQDRFGTYSAEPTIDSAGAEEGSYHVVRGGSWKRQARYCRSGHREYLAAGDPSFDLGFRLVLEAD